MTTVLGVVAVLFKLAGVVFLFAAALGVLRFPDALQRMHAATKAGTVGAGLTVIGAVLSLGRLDAAIIGTLTVMFLLLTVPVAGHLLGRAAYVSGAALVGLGATDALKGVLDRHRTPLEQRTALPDAGPHDDAPVSRASRKRSGDARG